MTLSFQEWFTSNPDLQNPIMLDNSDFLKKISNDDFTQILQLIYEKVLSDRENVKERLVKIINNTYINNRQDAQDINNVIEIRDYIENNL